MAKDVTARHIARDAKRIERWERVRASGRSRFIWLTGVFGWGLAWAAAMLAWRWWDTGLPPVTSDVLIAAVVGIAGGLTDGHN
jgi:hypothetical protein